MSLHYLDNQHQNEKKIWQKNSAYNFHPIKNTRNENNRALYFKITGQQQTATDHLLQTCSSIHIGHCSIIILKIPIIGALWVRWLFGSEAMTDIVVLHNSVDSLNAIVTTMKSRWHGWRAVSNIAQTKRLHRWAYVRKNVWRSWLLAEWKSKRIVRWCIVRIAADTMRRRCIPVW